MNAQSYSAINIESTVLWVGVTIFLAGIVARQRTEVGISKHLIS